MRDSDFCCKFTKIFPHGTSISHIRQHTLRPIPPAIRSVYLLHGEEGYYIDALVDEFDKILGDDEKAFNQYTLYAPDVEPAAVSELCHRMPMMADRQVVILKEAQAVPAAKLNKLAAYAGSPSPTTILVICCRGAEAKAKDLIKAINSAKGVVFESKS